MSGIILQGQALKVVNKGGGFVTKTEVTETVSKFGVKSRSHRHLRSRERLKGSDYIVFNCPGCKARNKVCAYQCKGRAGNSLSFRCNRCYREIEVAAPTDTKIILDANSPAQKAGLVGPDGKPI